MNKKSKRFLYLGAAFAFLLTAVFLTDKKLVRNVLAATLFSNGFEDSDPQKWDKSQSSYGTISIENKSLSGLKGGHITAQASTSHGAQVSFTKKISWPAEKKLWYTCNFNVASATQAKQGGIYIMQATYDPDLGRSEELERADVEIVDPNSAVNQEAVDKYNSNTNFLLRLTFRGLNGSRDNHRQWDNVQVVNKNEWHKVQMLIDMSAVHPQYAWWLDNQFIWSITDETSGSDPPQLFQAGAPWLDWGNNTADIYVDDCSVSTTGPVPGNNNPTATPDANPTPTPTKTPTPPLINNPTATTTPSANNLAVDVNNDGQVNATDLKIVFGDWGTSATKSDIDQNGKINLLDAILVMHNLETPPATPTNTPTSDNSKITDWPQLAHDAAHTGFSPNAVSFDGATPFKWRYLNGTSQTPQTSYGSLSNIPAGYSFPFGLQPIAVGNKVFMGNHLGQVTALNLTSANGSYLWQTTTNGRGGNIGAIVQSLAWDNNLVFVPSTDHYLYALNDTTGAVVWSFKTLGSVTSPTIYNHVIYFGSSDGNLYAINTSGNLIWKYNVDAPIIAPPAVAQDKVFFGAENINAYALTLSGQLSWKRELRGSSFKNTWPVVSEQNNLVLFRTNYQFVNAEWDLWPRVGPLLKYVADNSSSAAVEKNILLKGESAIGQTLAGCGKTVYKGLDNEPDTKTFFALNTTNGAERFTVPIVYFGADGGAPPAPAVDARNGDIFAYFWTFGPNKTIKQNQAYGSPDCGGSYSPNPDIARLNPETGERMPLGLGSNSSLNFNTGFIQMDNVPLFSLAVNSSEKLVFVANYQWTGGFALFTNPVKFVNLWYPTSSNACCGSPRYYSWFNNEQDSQGYENYVPAKRRQIFGYAAPMIGPEGIVVISDWGGMLTAIK